MIKRYDFAPLDGITKVVFRKVWNEHFGGADRYFIPFFSPTDHHTITPRDFRELDPHFLPFFNKLNSLNLLVVTLYANRLSKMCFKRNTC